MFNKDIILNKDIFQTNRIPILCQEPSWEKLFGNVKDKSIQSLKEELLTLIDKEKELDQLNRKLQKEKLNSMKMILGISDSLNNENKIENIHLLDEYKEKIENINEKIDEVKFQLEIIPREIREVNLKLLNATIDYGYDELKRRENVVEKSNEKIQALREKLRELIETKYDYEEWITETYRFFHGILGPEITEKIDKERLK